MNCWDLYVFQQSQEKGRMLNWWNNLDYIDIHDGGVLQQSQWWKDEKRVANNCNAYSFVLRKEEHDVRLLKQCPEMSYDFVGLEMQVEMIRSTRTVGMIRSTGTNSWRRGDYYKTKNCRWVSRKKG